MTRRRIPRILAIDDDEKVLQIIEMVLKRQDYEVFTALNGIEGLAKATETSYVAKPVSPRELLARIKALLARSEFGRLQAATIVAMIGAKGGVGVTSLAVNLGIALTRHEESAVLVEWRLRHGTIRYLMNLPLGGPHLGQLADDGTFSPGLPCRV